VKTTQYFDHIRQRSDRAWIELDWIAATVQHPDHIVVQSDGRYRFWKKIEAAEGRYLRVITLEDRETVHNAFFDRNFKE
jgi:hypothetical protein